ncbi:hypothetical protein GEMRC1_007159 [Eukaryota sp. GEM-RC1]
MPPQPPLRTTPLTVRSSARYRTVNSRYLSPRTPYQSSTIPEPILDTPRSSTPVHHGITRLSRKFQRLSRWSCTNKVDPLLLVNSF